MVADSCMCIHAETHAALAPFSLLRSVAQSRSERKRGSGTNQSSIVTVKAGALKLLPPARARCPPFPRGIRWTQRDRPSKLSPRTAAQASGWLRRDRKERHVRMRRESISTMRSILSSRTCSRQAHLCQGHAPQPVIRCRQNAGHTKQLEPMPPSHSPERLTTWLEQCTAPYMLVMASYSTKKTSPWKWGERAICRLNDHRWETGDTHAQRGREKPQWGSEGVYVEVIYHAHLPCRCAKSRNRLSLSATGSPESMRSLGLINVPMAQACPAGQPHGCYGTPQGLGRATVVVRPVAWASGPT